jgi:four helix bundle protein
MARSIIQLPHVLDQIAVMRPEKLRVEIKTEELITEVARLLRKVPYHCNACRHLEKSADAVYLNLGEGVSSFRPRKKASKYDIAREEAGEVQRALSAIVLKGKLTNDDVAGADDAASHIIAMLTNMIKNLEDRS